MADKPENALSSEQMDEMMKELEELEKEIESSQSQVGAPEAGEAPEAQATAVASAETETDGEVEVKHDDFFGKGGPEASDSMEDSLGDLKEEESSSRNSLFDTTASAEENADTSDAEVTPDESGPEEMIPEEKPMSKKSPSQESTGGALTLTLKGEMSLNLEYETGGSTVCVAFSDGFLHVTLADGTEFKIPMPTQKSAKLRSVA